ncbi:MAG TPA: M20/M25/M40 family metallo-hydrolase [Bryobacteraceae bacterium]|nr:M20/M25/M40 family metallo-hydrolase [Bryobacteraceae bacterium]
MWRVGALILVIAFCGGAADDNRPLGDRTRQYLTDLIHLDTSNPPGNETRVAEYLKQVTDSHGIQGELMGSDPLRMNFVARLKGSGKGRPLLLMAHSDTVPAERSQWSVDPFSAENRGGFIYGRGAQDDKSLLAAELAVMIELKRRNIKLARDLILLAESDEETGSTGIEWMIQHKSSAIDCEFALNEGGYIIEPKDGPKIFHVQTMEKVPMRIVVSAKGTAADASVPRSDDPVTHVATAVAKLAQADQPVHINPTTRRYFRELARVPEYAWLDPLRRRLEDPGLSQSAEAQLRAHDPSLDAMVRTTVVPTMLGAGIKNSMIPSTAQAQLDVRRLPSETREDVLARFKQIVNDPAIEITIAPSQPMPAAEPSAITTPLYHAMERAIGRMYPRDLVIPFMSAEATDGSFLRARGTAVYGVPVFQKEPVHGNDEKIVPKVLEDGVELLWQMVLETAGGG